MTVILGVSSMQYKKLHSRMIVARIPSVIMSELSRMKYCNIPPWVLYKVAPKSILIFDNQSQQHQ